MKNLLSLLAVLISFTAHAAQPLTSAEEVKAAFAKGRPMVIMFYTTWCGACKATKPEYLKAEKALEGKVDFYLMDSDKLGLRNGEHSVLRIEAIPSFSAGTTEQEVRAGTHFREGGGKANDLIKYVKEATGAK